MSIEALTWALHVPLGGNDKVVLLGLANHAHPDGTKAFPSWQTLAVYACCERTTVYRVLKRLEDGGWIARSGETRQGAVVYRLRMDRPVADRNVADRNGCAAATPPVAPLQPEPSVNRQERAAKAAPSPRERADRVPDDFPAELRPHLAAVVEILTSLAKRHHAKAVRIDSVAGAIMGRRHKPLVRSAYDFASWADGKTERRKDVVGGYRRWLDKVDELAGIEPLPDAPTNVVHLQQPESVRRANGWAQFYDEHGAREGLR